MSCELIVIKRGEFCNSEKMCYLISEQANCKLIHYTRFLSIFLTTKLKCALITLVAGI